MRYLTIAEVLETYQRVMQQSGGLVGIRDLGALESAIAQPYMTFGGNELYPSLAEKAAALGFSLIQNHPFTDGNTPALASVQGTDRARCNGVVPGGERSYDQRDRR